MEPERARYILHAATWDSDGTFTIMRLGEDPGKERVHELRLALRILWNHWKDKAALPFDISQTAAVILHFRSESEQNLRASKRSLRQEIYHDLYDLAQGAFELLSGSDAESSVVRRPDLNE